MAEFKLSNNTLRRMMSHMSDNMDRGLEGGLEVGLSAVEVTSDRLTSKIS